MSDGKSGSLVLLKPPTEIVFIGPFTDVVTANLQIENPQTKPICFKVKTTAPKQYCVRPNSGLIRPGETATVAVMLQPLDAIPPDAAKHKFMVQSTYVPNEISDFDAFWKTVNPSDLSYGKLRVVFENRTDVGRVESPATIDSHLKSNRTSLNSSDVEQQLRVEKDKVRKLESELENAYQEQNSLVRKLAALNEGGHKSAEGELGLPLVHVLLICLAGILLGLIVGKLF